MNSSSTSLGVSLSYAVLERVNMSVYYTINNNSSGQSSFAYSSRQAGLSLSYRY
jgi:hypothetical protein